MAVVVLARQPVFGPIRDKLGLITRVFFAQRDFTQTAILVDFYASLQLSMRGQISETTFHMGTSLRELVHRFRGKTLVLLKLLLLQKRLMFFGYPVEALCTFQYSLVRPVVSCRATCVCPLTLPRRPLPGLADSRCVSPDLTGSLGRLLTPRLPPPPPGLLMNLSDCGSPILDIRAATNRRASSLRTSDRASLLRFFGFPLNIFGKVRCSPAWQSLRAGPDTLSSTLRSAFPGLLLPAVPPAAADRHVQGGDVLGRRHDQRGHAAAKVRAVRFPCSAAVNVLTPSSPPALSEMPRTTASST